MNKLKQKALLPTDYGNFEILAFAGEEDERMPHLVLMNDFDEKETSVLVRIHSECITGDLFHSKRCDCGEQLDRSLKMIANSGGILIYLRQEGRGIGILNKLKAYNLQDQGMDTIEANIHLGFEADERDYKIAIEILNDLGISQIKLITNNPDKISIFDDSNITISERIPMDIPANEINSAYLNTKKNIMGHLLR